MIVIKKVDFVIFYRRVCNIIKEININITTGSNISVTFINESTNLNELILQKKKRCCKNINRITIYIIM